MTVHLLDSGVWLAARDRDDSLHDECDRLLSSAVAGELRLSALDLTIYEVANVAVVKRRSTEEAVRLVDLVRTLAERIVEVQEPGLIEAAIELAAAEDITSYDAAYVTCARMNGWTLISTNIRDLVGKGLAERP